MRMKTYLKQKIENHNEKNRNENALISNKQFDQLEKNLERIDPKANYFIDDNNLLLPSLPKGQIKGFLDGLLNKTRIIIEPKIIGCGIALQYQHGFLTKAISQKGREVTNKLKGISDVPNKIILKGLLQVRGELFAPSEYEKPYNSQKLAKGYLRAAESKNNHLSFCCFQILNGKVNQYESLNYLKRLGFTIPENHFCNYTSGVEMFRKLWQDGQLFYNYPNNGIVLKINSRKLQLLREKSHGVYPHWQIAIES